MEWVERGYWEDFQKFSFNSIQFNGMLRYQYQKAHISVSLRAPYFVKSCYVVRKEALLKADGLNFSLRGKSNAFLFDSNLRYIFLKIKLQDFYRSYSEK